MIPFADPNPVRRVPWATVLLVAACFLVYFGVQPTGTPSIDWTGVVEPVEEEDLRFVVEHAAIPCELVEGRPLTEREFRRTFRSGHTSACGDAAGTAHSPGKVVLLGLLTSLFLHGSIPHLFANLLFLWVFGNNVEHHVGWLRYLVLYVAGGVVATAAHVAVDPNSTVPIIGASGAIAAVMGAYFVLWPSARIKTIVFIGPIFLRKVQALWLLVIWVAQNLLLVGGDSGVAWAAHVGGFGFGALVGLWWRRQDRRAAGLTGLPTAPAPV